MARTSQHTTSSSQVCIQRAWKMIPYCCPAAMTCLHPGCRNACSLRIGIPSTYSINSNSSQLGLSSSSCCTHADYGIFETGCSKLRAQTLSAPLSTPVVQLFKSQSQRLAVCDSTKESAGRLMSKRFLSSQEQEVLWREELSEKKRSVEETPSD